MSKMLAFHNDPERQAKFINRVNWHYEQDLLVQGTYYHPDTQRGCAVGCTLHSSDHGQYATLIGVPPALAMIQDHLFEAMPIEDAREWARSFLTAIPLGADLQAVEQFIAAWCLEKIAELETRAYMTDELREVVRRSACFVRNGQTESEEGKAYLNDVVMPLAQKIYHAFPFNEGGWLVMMLLNAPWQSRQMNDLRRGEIREHGELFGAPGPSLVRFYNDMAGGWGEPREQAAREAASEMLRLLSDAPVPVAAE